MKRFLAIFFFLCATGSLAYDHPESDIRINIGGWDMSNSNFGIRADQRYLGNDERFTEVQFSGLSAGFAFSHTIGQRFAWEVSLGGLADGEIEYVESGDYYYETTYNTNRSVSMSYLTLGMLYYPLSELDRVESNSLQSIDSVFRPYLAAGVGSYFGLDMISDEYDIIDTDFATTRGGYIGGGVDLFMSRNFIFNIDLRYHLVEFDEPLKGETDYSGANILAGFKVAF